MKQSAQTVYIFSLGGKLALKICTWQGQVIVYPSQTNRKRAFLFKHTFFNLFHEKSHFKKRRQSSYVEHIVLVRS